MFNALVLMLLTLTVNHARRRFHEATEPTDLLLVVVWLVMLGWTLTRLCLG